MTGSKYSVCRRVYELYESTELPVQLKIISCKHT